MLTNKTASQPINYKTLGFLFVKGRPGPEGLGEVGITGGKPIGSFTEELASLLGWYSTAGLRGSCGHSGPKREIRPGQLCCLPPPPLYLPGWAVGPQYKDLWEEMCSVHLMTNLKTIHLKHMLENINAMLIVIE